MSKENIEVDPEHHEENHEEEQNTPIATEGEEPEISEVEGEEQAENDMLVLGGVDGAPELVGGQPELLLESEGGPVVLGR